MYFPLFELIYSPYWHTGGKLQTGAVFERRPTLAHGCYDVSIITPLAAQSVPPVQFTSLHL